MKIKEFIFWGLFGLINYLIFAWDIENDRDFWTWMWLFNSILGFYNSHRSWLIHFTKK
jgi:hypothetical protein